MAGIAQHRRPQHHLDIWPGFVDALSTLLMVIIFVLSVFILAQFFLTEQLAGRNEALKQLQTQVSELSDMLALERQSTKELRASVADLSAQLEASTAARDKLSAQVSALTESLNASKTDLEAAKEKASGLASDLANVQTELATARKTLAEREAKLAAVSKSLAESQNALSEEQRVSDARKSEVDRLTQNIAALRAELQRISAALDASEAKSKAQNVQIVNLGKRLNAALASKVEELSRYRSEFFGRLRQVLGNRKDIRIVGDRFVFQSEVLFGSADANLRPAGETKVAELAKTLLSLAKTIPADIDWTLAVEGYTDQRPISTPQFKSNWELSTARALSVVHALAADGVPPQRLMAVGFGPYHPIDPANTPEAWQRNRRIEFKLTQR